jgi:hypothetical protein
VEVDYYLGRAYHLNNEFDKADRFYQKFLDEVDEKHALRSAASRGKEQTANARLLKANPVDTPYPTSGNIINGDHPDFSPVLSVDGNALFYTSRRIRPDSSNGSDRPHCRIAIREHLCELQGPRRQLAST